MKFLPHGIAIRLDFAG